MGTISFNATVLTNTANEGRGHCKSFEDNCKKIETLLDVLENESNWSGDIKANASKDFTNTREAIASLEKSINEAFDTLESIASGFGKITY